MIIKIDNDLYDVPEWFIILCDLVKWLLIGTGIIILAFIIKRI